MTTTPESLHNNDPAALSVMTELTLVASILRDWAESNTIPTNATETTSVVDDLMTRLRSAQ